jgi:signal transduction histidine kinase
LPSMFDAAVNALAEASGAALLAVDAEGRILSHSERFDRMWDVPPKVLAARSLADLARWLRQTNETSGAKLATILEEQGGPNAGELTQDGGRIIAWSSQPFDPGGQTQKAGRVWVFHDMTLARQAASSLRDAENWLAMFEAHTDGIVLELDVDIRVVGIWATKKMFFEQPDAQLQGRSLDHALGEAAGAVFDEHIARVFATGEPESFEYILDSNGTRRVFAANAILLAGDDRAPRVTVLVQDITARARLQNQLLQAERLASVGLLAAGVAHEINNPLAYVLLHIERLRHGIADLQTERPGDAKLASLAQSVEICSEGSKRVHEIVDNLCRVSRSNADEMQTPVEVQRVLTFAIALASPAVRRRATIVCEFGRVPAVLASEGRLNQIFLNLIINAAHSIPEGAPDRNEIRLVTHTDDAGRAVIEVHDTGAGIPAAHLQHIFDPFFTTKPLGEGTGLGLAICHGITTSLGGEIVVESHVGEGSVFRVALPAAPDSSKPSA